MNNAPSALPLAARILIFLLGTILFLTPLIVLPGILYNFVTSKSLIFIGLTDVAVGLYVWLTLFYPQHWPKRNAILYAFLAWLGVTILSASVGTSPQFSFWSGMERADGMILLIHVFLFFLMLASVVKSKKILKAILAVSVVAALCIAFSIYVGPAGIALYHSFYNSGQFGGFSGNDSFAGAYLLFNIGFAAYLFLEAKSKKIKWLWAGTIALILFSPTFFNFAFFQGKISLSEIIHHPLVLIGTARGATMGLGLGIILAFLLAALRHTKKWLRTAATISLPVFLAAVVVVITLLFTSGTGVRQWFANQTGIYRFIYWHQSIEGFKDRPLLGWGPGTFSAVTATYFDPLVLGDATRGAEPWANKPHGIVFDLLVHTGILGLITYIGLLAALLVTLWRSKRILHSTKAILSGVLLAYVMQNLILFDVLMTYLMFAFLLALVVISDRDEEMVSSQTVTPKVNQVVAGWALLGIALPILFLVWYFSINPLREVHERYKLLTRPPAERAFLYKKIGNISPFGSSIDDEYSAELLYLGYLSNLRAIGAQKDRSVFVADVDGALSSLADSLTLHGMTYRGALTVSKLYNLHYLLARKNDPATIVAMKQYAALAINLSPQNPEGYWAYAQGFIYEDNYPQAMAILEQGLALAPKLAETHKIIINLARLIGDQNVLKEKIDRAQQDVSGFSL